MVKIMHECRRRVTSSVFAISAPFVPPDEAQKPILIGQRSQLASFDRLDPLRFLRHFRVYKL